MQYKTIVAVIRGEKDLGRVMDVASAFALQSQGHVIGVHAEPSPAAYAPSIGGEGFAYDESLIEANRQRMESLRQAFENRCRADGIAHEWRGIESFSGDSAVSAISSAFAADLCVIQQINPDEIDDLAADLEALVMESGRPVLVVPYTWSGPPRMQKIAIAWNGKREAARATFDALPLLKEAKSVEIVCVNPGETDEHSALFAGGMIAEALTRHGVDVDVVNLHAQSIPVSAAIQNRLAENGTDLLVMGAYSRSPFRERLFGGVTKDLFSSMTALTLMSK
jgi:nucleotide-binding universal stress UspA family protein